ncbi:glycoside hydrolase family 18 protein [Trichoderma ceciliae]
MSVNMLQAAAAVCSYILVQSGDSCARLATRCGITPANFTKYNPSSTICSTLQPKQPVCCSAGTLPNLAPQPSPNGTCATYTVKSGDYCDLIALNNYITTTKIESWNKQTWGWTGCSGLQLGMAICLSTGSPPMPAPVKGTVCGPQVAGSKPPSNWSQIGSLNPCPLNACCNIWGQCGITPDFCTPSKSSTGAPGTAAPGSNGCISNCGTSIVNSGTPPTEFKSIGYFESFAATRSCLAMDASQLPTSYTHIHYAFGSITKDFQVDPSASMDQFEIFANSTGFKRILSFGGWSFSTSQDSAPIFQQGVTDANRQTFAQSAVNVMGQYNLDGVDFDWEYPGAADIKRSVPGSPSDGPNYLSFLQKVRAILPAGKTLSMAAPASYWYLKGFPIASMAQVLDYIVYMTYDLHGQWDYNSTFANPGCPTGNCLRSHVNLTETEFALSMITKAGVATNKIAVGIAGYGRSFGMANPSCTGPQCLFKGPASAATPGECTNEAGYISQAELEALSNPSNGALSRRGITTWYDSSSDSDMMTYGDGTWVAYMSQQTKANRINRYAGNNFAGSVEWAIDLVQFVETPDEAQAKLNITEMKNAFTSALALSNYDMTQYPMADLTTLATALFGWDGCDSKERTAILSGWQQSWKIMNPIYKEAKAGINWNEASTVEYLGPPAFNKKRQADVTNIFKNLATIQPSWIPDYLSCGLAVRCDDAARECTCGVGKNNIVAYTTNKDAKYNSLRINFCPLYFRTPSLDDVMENADERLPLEIWASMVSYQSNQGRAWIHKLLHINKVQRLRHMERSDTEPRAYGAAMTKALARFSPLVGTTGDFNALGGVYPHYPLAPKPPSKVTPPPRFTVDGYFTIDSNDTVEIPANRTLLDAVDYALDNGVCLEADDEDGDANADAFFTVSGVSQVIVETDYPADYLSSCIAIYSKVNYAGDYYVLEGHNLDGSSDQYLVIRTGNLPQTSTMGNSCQWFTNGGNTRANCSAGTLSQPLSWSVLGGVCTAHNTNDCSNDGNAQAYDPPESCHSYSASNNDLKTWVSLQCGAQVGPSRTQKHSSVVTKAVYPNLHTPFGFQPRPTS